MFWAWMFIAQESNDLLNATSGQIYTYEIRVYLHTNTPHNIHCIYSGFTPGTPVFTHYTSARQRYAPMTLGSDNQQSNLKSNWNGYKKINPLEWFCLVMKYIVTFASLTTVRCVSQLAAKKEKKEKYKLFDTIFWNLSLSFTVICYYSVGL